MNKIASIPNSQINSFKLYVFDLFSAPVRPSGENEIVLAVTQRREPTLHSSVPTNQGTSLARHNTVVGDGTYQRYIQRPLPSYLVSRHHSFNFQQNGRVPRLGSGSELPSPLANSNLSSLQSLLMSSQIAVFNSSTERLSLSSQTNNPNLVQQQQQPISVPLRQLPQIHHPLHATSGLGASTSPLTISPATSNLHLPQPRYFSERPPSYRESMLMKKLRSSDRFVGATTSNKDTEDSASGTAVGRSCSCRV